MPTDDESSEEQASAAGGDGPERKDGPVRKAGVIARLARAIVNPANRFVILFLVYLGALA